MRRERSARFQERGTSLQERVEVRVLPDELVNQIAAGEVVERPASVVKELVENAIDAGAAAIEIVLADGGKRLIEVSDDGSGMSVENAVIALERHATSKIASFTDLTQIRTLGFRGEALPSIASVSDFSLTTWDGVAEHGVELLRSDDGSIEVRPAARPRGTTIRVADLFEKVPARRKFLKSADGEFRAIVTIVTSYALPNPQRSFRVAHNGRVVLDLPAATSMRERVLQVIGFDADPHLVEINESLENFSAHGFATRELRYGSRRNQYFFVNGRLVRDRVLTHAVNRAAEAFDREGHPGIFLFLEIDPEAVDVNVHPAKTEVRFRDSGRVHVLVEHSVKRAIGAPQEGARLLESAENALPENAGVQSGSFENREVPAFPPQLASQTSLSSGPVFSTSGGSHVGNSPLFQQSAVVQPPRQEPGVDLGSLRGKVIGQYRDSYILLDTPEGLRLVDQHVAHERVLFDRLEDRSSEEASSQRLLTPYIFEAGVADAASLETHLEELRFAGFDVERFSGSSFGFSAVPAALVKGDIDRFIRKLLDAASEDRSHLLKLRDRINASVACQAAIKVHRPMTGSEMSRLVEDLLVTRNPFACPHGRPILVDIRHIDIEKHFHRK